MENYLISKIGVKVLIYLNNHPKINISRLSMELNLVYGNLCKRINLLEQQGLINKIKEDKKSYQLSLTQKGKEVVVLILKLRRLCG